MVEKIQYIPARLRNMAKEGHVAGTADIIDDGKNKTQEQINEEVIGDNAESHKNRIAALDQIHSINVDDQEHAITTNPEDIVKGSGLIPTANAVAGVKSELIDNYGHYAENPEFVRVYLDSKDRVLWGIQRDGNIYYGAGVPQQVIDYIEKRIEDLSLDEYEDIVDFLNGLEKGDKTLQEIINEINASIDTKANAQETADALNLKVDKVEGKSLIDEKYASTKSTMESPEFVEVTLDAQDKVLEGIQADGTKVIGGDLNVGGSANINGNLRVLSNMEVSGVSYKVIENPEYLVAWVDAEYKVIFGFKTDGKTYIGDTDFFNEIKNNQEAINEIKSYLANFDNLDIDALSSITAVENSEYIDVKVDSEDRILEGITTDGIKKINIPVDNGVAIIETTDNTEFIEAKVDAEGKLIEGINKNGEKIFGVIPPQIKQYIDENMPIGGSGVQSIEYDEETGDMYATYDDEGGITDVSMEPNGDIYVEYEE